MNTDGTCFHTCKECHKTESLWNHTTTDHKEREQLEDRRSVGANSYNSGDGTDQRVQSLMFMMMMTSRTLTYLSKKNICRNGRELKISLAWITIIIIIIIITLPVITLMPCIYNYVPETNHVYMLYSVAAVLYLQFVLHVMLFPIFRTFRWQCISVYLSQ